MSNRYNATVEITVKDDYPEDMTAEEAAAGYEEMFRELDDWREEDSTLVGTRTVSITVDAPDSRVARDVICDRVTLFKPDSIEAIEL